MLPSYCVLAFILTISGCYGTQWQVLEDFKQSVNKYARLGEEVIRDIEQFFVKMKYESLDFLYEIEHTPYLERGEMRPYCTNVYQQLDGLVYSFKADFATLETPLINMRLEIKDRISDLISTIGIYQKQAENKHQLCRPGNYDCEERIFLWLEANVHRLQCRLMANCGVEKNHTIARRSALCEEFLCNNGECILFENVCNNNSDCQDGSDETPDCTRYCFDGYHCRDLRCVRKEQVCDGTWDCGDGADEERCKTPELLYTAENCGLSSGGFLCSNRYCVPLAQVCDGNDDCGDSSDEGEGCSEQQCSAGCTASGGVCLLGPNGALCLNDCPNGTADQGGTCRAGPMQSPGSLDALYEQVPYLLERYVGAVTLLKKRLISSLEQAFLACQGPQGELRSLRPIRKLFQTSQ